MYVLERLLQLMSMLFYFKLQGGSKFMILLEQDLPSDIDFPVRVKFGDVPDGVVKAYLKNHVLTGSRIPGTR